MVLSILFNAYLYVLILGIHIVYIYKIFKIVKKLYYKHVERKERKRQLLKLTRNKSGQKSYAFQWKIENIRYCCKKEGEYIESPAFIANSLEGTKWCLRLYPRGIFLFGVATRCYLHRENDRDGPNVNQIKYQLSLFEEHDWISAVEGADDFTRDCTGSKFLEMESFLDRNSLTIHCNMWKEEEKPALSEGLSARTLFQGHRGSFAWKLDKFHTLPYGILSNFVVTNKLKDVSVNFDLVCQNESVLYIDIRCDDHILFCSFEVSFRNNKGKKKYFDSIESYKDDNGDRMCRRISLNRDNFLRNDTLSLDCEYIFSSGNILSEYTCFGTISSSEPNTHKKPKKFLDLQDDLKSMYSDAKLCDVELRTATQKFPAHKAILSARSTVFERMFSNDMREKHSERVDIVDLDDKTIHRLLTYIYTDSLEDLQLESASKLYTVADKYDIPSLKRKCSSFLKEFMCSNTVCDVLVLADMHQDDDLKCAAQDYIQRCEEVVLPSQQWKLLMATNPVLVADVMYRRLSKKME